MPGALGRPGSTIWLVAHDLKLGWRDLRARSGRLGSAAMAGALAAVLLVVHAAVWSLPGGLPDSIGDGGPAPGPALAATAFLLLLMLAQTLNGATRLLYARGDLDLLLASPLPPRRVLVSRGLAVAAGAFASAAIFVLPVADAAALQGRPRLLALYPTLAAAALLTAAGGLALALGLFRLIGPRRTRAAAQALAALIGAAFVLAVQFDRLLDAGLPLPALPAAGPWRALATLPARAALGDGPALLAWIALAAAGFAAVVLPLGPAFAAGTGRAATSAPRARRAGRRDPAALFAGGAMAQLRAKERRVILRDPWLISQVMLQVLYMLPMGAALWTTSGSPALALAPTVAVVCFQVSSALTWLSLSAEDAPELLDTSPLPAAARTRAKVQAVGALVLAVVGAPLAYLAIRVPAEAAATAGLCAAGLGTAVLLQLWHVKPARRTAFAARYRESRLVTAIEMGLSVLFGLAAALVAQRSAWALAPVALVGLAGAALAARRARRSRGVGAGPR